MNDDKLVAEVGQEKFGTREDNLGNRAGFTAVLLAAHEGAKGSPETLFNAIDPKRLSELPLNRAPRNLSIRPTESATYDGRGAIDMARGNFPDKLWVKYQAADCGKVYSLTSLPPN